MNRQTMIERLVEDDMKVICRYGNRVLNKMEIINEINRDRSEGWTDYDLKDLKEDFEDTTYWIDRDYYIVEINGEEVCTDKK